MRPATRDKPDRRLGGRRDILPTDRQTRDLSRILYGAWACRLWQDGPWHGKMPSNKEFQMARTPQDAKTFRRDRGFEPTSGLLRTQIRAAGEARGFALTRLLTHWAEVAGADLALITRPVKMTYAKTEGMGATLILLVQSAHAPMVQMALPRLKERVNATYGYNAISRIALTQTASTGFAEGQAEFMAKPKADRQIAPEVQARAADQVAPIHDADLRGALERLAQNVLSRTKPSEGSST